MICMTAGVSRWSMKSSQKTLATLEALQPVSYLCKGAMGHALMQVAAGAHTLLPLVSLRVVVTSKSRRWPKRRIDEVLNGPVLSATACLPVSSSCLAPSNPVAVAPFHNMQAYNDSPVTSEPTSLPGSPTQRESFPQLTPSASQTCQPSHHAESPSTPTFASHSFVVSSASASRSIKRLPMSRTTSALPTLRSFSSAGHPSPNATLHRRHFGGKHDQVSPSSACRSGAFSPTKRSRHISTFGSLNVRSGGLLRSPTLRQGQNGTKPGRARAGSGSHFQLRPVPAAKRRKVGERSRERGAKEVSTSSERDVRSRAAQSFGVDAESSAGEAVARGSERNMDVDVPSDAELAVKAGACSELTENGPASLEVSNQMCRRNCFDKQASSIALISCSDLTRCACLLAHRSIDRYHRGPTDAAPLQFNHNGNACNARKAAVHGPLHPHGRQHAQCLGPRQGKGQGSGPKRWCRCHAYGRRLSCLSVTSSTVSSWCGCQRSDWLDGSFSRARCQAALARKRKLAGSPAAAWSCTWIHAEASSVPLSGPSMPCQTLPAG